MKLKKYISKLLFCSILLNNIYFYSNASYNSNLNRYEILEGEFIDLSGVDDSDISEIEIFGNTIQDENNLEDIQSVGDLYVDEEGEPVLDELGRKQYKVEIESYGRNLIDSTKCIMNAHLNRQNGEVILGSYMNSYYVTDFIPVYSGITYFKYARAGEVILYDKNKVFLKDISNSDTMIFSVPKDCKFVRLMGNITGFNKTDIFRVNDGDSKYAPFQYNKTTVILPCQLMRVGNVYDRLYWDGEKGKYVVEKNIKTMILDASDDEKWGGYGSSCHWPDPQFTKHNIISSNSAKPAWTNGVYIHPHGLIYLFHGLGEMSNAQFKQWLSENPVTIVFEPTNSELIETNITKKIELTTYPEKTYVSTVSENRVNPTLKIYIDKLEETSQKAVDNAVSTPTSNNIVLARMFVNMLPESLYKDQLQAKLNEIFSEDMVLDRLSVTANLDVYIQSENILMMSLNTNTVTFEDYSGVEELELQNAINISINSSLPYQLNAYIVGGITNKDKNKTLDLDVLNIKDNSELEYKKFEGINNKLVLLDNVEKGNDISHNIDLKLSGDKAHDADVYKTTIKFEAEQK